MHDKTRADVCRALFGTHQELTLLAMQRFNASRESVIYNSLWWDKYEHSNLTDTLKMAEQFMKSNPDDEKEYNEDKTKYSVVPYRKDDLNDAFFEMLEKELQKNQDYYDQEMPDAPTIDYMEGGEIVEDPESMPKPIVNPKGQVQNEEVVQNNVVYSQPHHVQKYPTEIGKSQVGNFENPYQVAQQQQPVQQQQPYATGNVNFYPNGPVDKGKDFVAGNVVNYPQNPQQYPPLGGYGNLPPPYPQPYGFHESLKRVKRSKPMNDSGSHWGIHRLLSTGVLIFKFQRTPS